VRGVGLKTLCQTNEHNARAALGDEIRYKTDGAKGENAEKNFAQSVRGHRGRFFSFLEQTKSHLTLVACAQFECLLAIHFEHRLT
jgi:hypothetical protein